jgi:hypothetical protein
VLDVADPRHAIGERGKIWSAAGGFEFAYAVQGFGERDQVNGLLVFAERDHLIEDAAVLFQEKIFGLEIFDGGVEGVIIEQNGAKNGAFGFEILWQWAFESGFSRHRESFCFRLLFAL